MPTFTTNDGVTLTYEDTGGHGTPLVLVHGWGQTQAMFHNQLTGLGEHRRVITYDQRGHGVSEKPHHGYRIARLAQDFEQLLDHLGLDEADGLGWSMGASVLWSYIDNHGTGRLRKLVVVDQPAAVAAVPWMSGAEQTDSGAIFDVAGLLDLGAAMNGPDGFAAVEAFEKSMFSGDTDPAVWDFVVNEIKSTPGYAGVPLLFDHCAQDWRDVLPRIDIPTLVLGCDGSHVSPASQRYIAERVPDAQLHIFPTTEASSHFVFLENPVAFDAVVDKFLG
ncbi:alpha/beta fold hydrolase [Amycolatopsis sp. NPDC101161]|uniref:alpha/beta fold hydrolase n=1 Tax=Amycolatopsis sp. NPDC101161 TaxID=3363940 RepID=UPI0038265D1A